MSPGYVGSPFGALPFTKRPPQLFMCLLALCRLGCSLRPFGLFTRPDPAPPRNGSDAPGHNPARGPFHKPRFRSSRFLGRSCESRPARPGWVAIAPDWNPPRVNSAPRKLDYFRTRPGNRTRDPLPGAPRGLLWELFDHIPGGVNLDHGRAHCFSKVVEGGADDTTGSGCGQFLDGPHVPHNGPGLIFDGGAG